MAPSCQRRTTCRLCGSLDLTEVLSLAATPPANAFISHDLISETQPIFPLDVFFCGNCRHVQLLDVVDPAILFENYVYVSGTSPLFVKHFEDYARYVLDTFVPVAGTRVLDIGSNDGTLLRFFKDAGFSVLGIDPAIDIAAQATANGIKTITGFFGPETALAIKADHGAFSIITANNVFAHIDDLGGVLDGVAALLEDDGVFVFEVSYLVDVFEKTLFDTIYHEHLAYHAVAPLIPFMRAHGMELIEAVRVDSHGGSLRAVARPAAGSHTIGNSVAALVDLEVKMGLNKADTYRDFGTRIDVLKAELSSLLRGLKEQGHSIAAFGAPAKATTLMYHFGIGADLIDFIVDDSPLKQGLYSPGMHIPVVPSEVLYDKKPDYVVVLAWNFADPIMKKHQEYTRAGGHFIVPLPDVNVH